MNHVVRHVGVHGIEGRYSRHCIVLCILSIHQVHVVKVVIHSVVQLRLQRWNISQKLQSLCIPECHPSPEEVPSLSFEQE